VTNHNIISNGSSSVPTPNYYSKWWRKIGSQNDVHCQRVKLVD